MNLENEVNKASLKWTWKTKLTRLVWMNLENKVNKDSLNELENKVNKASLNELGKQSKQG